MEHSFNNDESIEFNSKNDRKNKIETQRKIRELKEQQRLKKELDYYDFEDYEE